MAVGTGIEVVGKAGIEVVVIEHPVVAKADIGMEVVDKLVG